MTPILYESTETKFTSNGICRLSGLTSCTVTEERNGSYELEAQLPVSDSKYSELVKGRIIFAQPADGKDPQPFQIYKLTKDSSGMCTINAEHISYRLGGIPVAPFSANGITQALQGLVSNSLITNPFTVWTDISNGTSAYKQAEPASFRERLGGTSGSILDVFSGSGGCEYEFDKFTVKLHAHRGTDTGVQIRYGKNLQTLQQEESIEGVYTGCIAYWYSEQEGTLVSGEVQYVENHAKYPTERIYVLDASQDYQDAPTADQLNTRAQSYIKQNAIGTPKINLTVSFAALWQTEEYKSIAPLERVNLCDLVTIIFPELGVSAKSKVIKTVFNVLTERYDSIELGDAKSSFVQAVSDVAAGEAGKQINTAISPIKSLLQSTIDAQSDMIRGGVNGYVVFGTNGDGATNEIYVMDTNDKATATKVIRINNNGIGFSTTGINGPYTTAWTIDGKFNADFITAGTISGNLIQAGTIRDKSGNNYWNLETGEIQISSVSEKVDSAVKSVTYYYLQNYGAVPEKTDSAWSTTAPAWVDGMHVWQMVETEYISGEKVKSAPVDITGNTGATGSTGATGDSGRGIVSQKIEYTLSTSPYQIIDKPSVIGTSEQIVFGVVGTYKGISGGSYPLYLSKPNSACGVWVSEQPAVSDGYYLWSKTTSNYSDGTSDYILRSESNLTEIKKQSDENAKNYNSLSTNVDSLETRVASNEDVISHVTMWNKFDADGLTIGKDGSANKININEKQITFYNGDDQVAYVNNNWLYITNGNFTNTLQIGKFAFVPRANGSLDFKKVG